MAEPDPRFCVAGGLTSDIRGVLGLSNKALGYAWNQFGSDGYSTAYNVYMLRPAGDVAKARAWAAQHPGSIWLLGNEPNVGPPQDNQVPRDYVPWFKNARSELKAADPAAIIAGPGVGQDSGISWESEPGNPYLGRPSYLRYMWDVLRYYWDSTTDPEDPDKHLPMPLDILCYHAYGETDMNKPDTWQVGRDLVVTVTNNWQSFWPARDGEFGYPYSKKPLFLTEFADTAVAGVNNPKPWHYVQSDVESFMQAVCDFFRDTAAGRQPSLNRWFWFVCHGDPLGWITYLHTGGTLEYRGVKYRNMANVFWDSDWFSVGAWDYYDKAHNMGVQPTRLELLFRHTPSGEHAYVWRVDTFYIGSGSGNSYGGHISHVNSAWLRVWTGWYPGYCPQEGWVTSGQYRVLAYG